MKRSTERSFRRLLPESPALWFLALAISLALWAAVHLEQNTAMTLDVPLAVTLPEDKVLVSDVPDKVKVTVTGPWTQLKNLESRSLTHELDLSDFDLGTSILYLDPNDFSLPPRTRAVRVSPSQLTISFARKVSKVVPVTPNITGQPAPGYEVRGFTCQPAEVTIEGAQSEVDILEEVVTEQIDITDRKSSLTAEVGLFLLSRNIWPKGKVRFKVSVDIEPVTRKAVLHDVPVEVIPETWSGRLTMDPPAVSIVLYGPSSKMKNIDISGIHAVVSLEETGGVPKQGLVKPVKIRGLPGKFRLGEVQPPKVRIVPKRKVDTDGRRDRPKQKGKEK